MNKRDEKPIEEILIDVIRTIAGHFSGQYHVVIGSDDGGKVIEVRIEMKDIGAPLSQEHPKFPISKVRASPGRIILLKVPAGGRKKTSL